MNRILAEAAHAEQAYLLKNTGREEYVLFERDGGYTGNYIRVYCDGAEEGAYCRVRLLQPFRDGMKGEIVE